MGNRSSFARSSFAGLWFARGEPWTVEGKLHLALAAVAFLGWTVAYTVLTRGPDGSPHIASENAGAKVTASLAR